MPCGNLVLPLFKCSCYRNTNGLAPPLPTSCLIAHPPCIYFFGSCHLTVPLFQLLATRTARMQPRQRRTSIAHHLHINRTSSEVQSEDCFANRSPGTLSRRIESGVPLRVFLCAFFTSLSRLESLLTRSPPVAAVILHGAAVASSLGAWQGPAWTVTPSLNKPDEEEGPDDEPALTRSCVDPGASACEVVLTRAESDDEAAVLDEELAGPA